MPAPILRFHSSGNENSGLIESVEDHKGMIISGEQTNGINQVHPVDKALRLASDNGGPASTASAIVAAGFCKHSITVDNFEWIENGFTSPAGSTGDNNGCGGGAHQEIADDFRPLIRSSGDDDLTLASCVRGTTFVAHNAPANAHSQAAITVPLEPDMTIISATAGGFNGGSHVGGAMGHSNSAMSLTLSDYLYSPADSLSSPSYSGGLLDQIEENPVESCGDNQSSTLPIFHHPPPPPPPVPNGGFLENIEKRHLGNSGHILRKSATFGSFSTVAASVGFKPLANWFSRLSLHHRRKHHSARHHRSWMKTSASLCKLPCMLHNT